MASSSQFSLSTKPVSKLSQDKTTTAAAKGRGRSSSFASALKKLLPSKKAERGGTLRKHGYHGTLNDVSPPENRSTAPISHCSRSEPSDKLVRWNTAIDLGSTAAQSKSASSPGTRSQRLYLERREKRRQRRSLKESGDYLGVQGINPSTGEMDVLTPSNSSASSPFGSLARAVQDKRAAYEGARRALRSEKMRKWEMDKAALKAERRRRVRWTRNDSAWSSAVEPDLSPIEGSSAASTPREEERSTETVVRTPSVRDESSDYLGCSGGHHNWWNEADRETFALRHPSTTLPGSSTSGIVNHIRRKPVPKDACLSAPHEPVPQPSTTTRRTLSSQSSYSDLIPVESEFPSQSPPMVGPKPAG